MGSRRVAIVWAPPGSGLYGRVAVMWLMWLGLAELTSTQRTPQSALELNLDENGKEVDYILTPLHVRRERREFRPQKAHNEYVMFDHETKECDELPAIHPCFTYEVCPTALPAPGQFIARAVRWVRFPRRPVLFPPACCCGLNLCRCGRCGRMRWARTAS